ncbi:ATPase AAA [Persicobacter psychrovividus]|uniref:ATPase AAA n=2 Tax=Persicobacter psychrovividus TaxID=387638 RepID=A0ABM7VEM9_9BACT|nr:ATPase AAA [Persicobacter psychrovividus]
MDNPMNQRKALPIGIQTFEDLRTKEAEYVYVDKTQHIHQMVALPKGYYFLSRPRRFGKSMLCSTFQSLFEGKQELFEGLYIHDKWDWSQSYPVIRIDLSGINYKNLESVNDQLANSLLRNCLKHNLSYEDLELKGVGPKFGELIEKIHQKSGKKIVILIDEYDKPVQDTLSSDDQLAAKSLDVLRGFYSAIKASDQYIRFCFMTGITKFTGVGLFSGANNFEDITLDSQYASICGFTQKELETCFGNYFDDVDMEEVKAWYNGYNYLGDKVYNPFDILLFLKKQADFDNYWWDSGQPTFITKIFSKGEMMPYQLSNMVLPSEELKQFNLNNLNLVSLLWQAGYLTIAERIKVPMRGYRYRMAIPNNEIQVSLNNLFLMDLTGLRQSNQHHNYKAFDAIYDHRLGDFEKAIKAMFSAIPYNNYVQNNIDKFEGYYASVMYVYLMALGLKTHTEEATSHGRIDLVMETPTHIYVVEFKVNAPKPEGKEKGEAIQQIHEKKYYAPYLNDDRKIILIGMHFNEAERNLDWFEVDDSVQG